MHHQREPLPAATSTGEAGLFTFHTWSRQLRAFIKEVVGDPAVLLCNSGERLCFPEWAALQC